MSSPASAHPSQPPGPHEVGDMLDTLAAADLQLAQELDRIALSRSPMSRTTVAALERLLASLRPAADVRSQLAAVDRRVLGAAIRLRRQRYDQLRVVGGGVGDQH